MEEEAFSAWLAGETAHRRPLFVLAAAIEGALEPERPVVRLSGREVIQALARRELTRLRDEGEDAGLPVETLPRLAALAAVSGGLDAAALRRLAEAEGTLELGLPPAEEVMDRLQPTGRLVPVDGARRFPAPAPDLVAAALLVEVLSREPELAPERLWAAAKGDLPEALERIGRLAYDAEVTLGLLDQRPSEWLRRALAADPGRCGAAAGSFYEVTLPAGLVPAAPAVWEAFLDPDGPEEQRAKILNNRSVHLAAAGRAKEALGAIEKAVEINRRLASANPSCYEPELALSLNNLSIQLAESGRGEKALGAIGEAVEIDRRLAAAHPARYEPKLAQSLNNLSNRLAETVRGGEGVGAIEEAAKIYRRLAAAHPARYEPELAGSLNNLSNRFAGSGRGEEALGAIEEAVGIFRRLTAANPARYEPELASSLNNLSVDLTESGRGEAALEAIREAVRIRRRLATANPVRYEPDLAQSLGNLSNRLAESGRGEEALRVIEEAVAIRRRLASPPPERYEPDLAQSLHNLSLCLADSNRGEEALAAVKESVAIRRRLASAHPARYEPELAQSLNNLSNRLAEWGRRAEALEASREAWDLIQPYARRAPDGPHGRWATVIRANLDRRDAATSGRAEASGNSEPSSRDSGGNSVRR